MYLGYSLVKSTLTEHLTKVYLAFGLVFAGLGLVIGGSALLAVYRIEKEEREGGGSREEYEAETPEENAGLLEETKDQEEPEGDESALVQEETEDGDTVPVQEEEKVQ